MYHKMMFSGTQGLVTKTVWYRVFHRVLPMESGTSAFDIVQISDTVFFWPVSEHAERER